MRRPALWTTPVLLLAACAVMALAIGAVGWWSGTRLGVLTCTGRELFGGDLRREFVGSELAVLDERTEERLDVRYEAASPDPPGAIIHVTRCGARNGTIVVDVADPPPASGS